MSSESIPMAVFVSGCSLLFSVVVLFFYLYGYHRARHVLTHSSPTRRSSDLDTLAAAPERPHAGDEHAAGYLVQHAEHPSLHDARLRVALRGNRRRHRARPRAERARSADRLRSDRRARQSDGATGRVPAAPDLTRRT